MTSLQAAAARDWFPLLQHGGLALDVVANVVTVDDRVFSTRFGAGRVSGVRRKPSSSRAFGGHKYVHPKTRLVTASCENILQVLFDSGVSEDLRSSLVRYILPPDLTPIVPCTICNGGRAGAAEEIYHGGAKESGSAQHATQVPSTPDGAEKCRGAPAVGSRRRTRSQSLSQEAAEYV